MNLGLMAYQKAEIVGGDSCRSSAGAAGSSILEAAEKGWKRSLLSEYKQHDLSWLVSQPEQTPYVILSVNRQIFDPAKEVCHKAVKAFNGRHWSL